MFQKSSSPFVPSYMSELSRHVDVSDILPPSVDLSNKFVENSCNKSNEDTNKINLSFASKNVFVRIQKLDEDYIQVRLATTLFLAKIAITCA